MSDFPPPFDPPSLTVPYPPPEVGEGSPWAPVDAENRDRILDWWRAWWRRVFFPWLSSFINALNTWLEAAEAYIIAHAIAGYSIRLTPDALNPTGTTDVEITLGEDVEFRPLVVGDVVLDQTIDSRFGVITVVIDDTHATVQTQGSVKGFAGHGWWVTGTVIAHAGTTDVVLTAESDRAVQLNDLVVDESASSAYGIVTAVTDPTHVTVAYINTLQGEQGIQGIQGIQGDPGVVQSVVAGANITVDDTDPANPIVSGAAGSGVVDSVVAGTHITVDSTDPTNPVVSTTGVATPADVAAAVAAHQVDSVVAGTGITVDNTDPDNPIVSSSGGGGGTVDSVVAGTNITVNNTDPANPIVATSGSVATTTSVTAAIAAAAGNYAPAPIDTNVAWQNSSSVYGFKDTIPSTATGTEVAVQTAPSGGGSSEAVLRNNGSPTISEVYAQTLSGGNQAVGFRFLTSGVLKIAASLSPFFGFLLYRAPIQLEEVDLIDSGISPQLGQIAYQPNIDGFTGKLAFYDGTSWRTVTMD